jgi:hypothetical protein
MQKALEIGGPSAEVYADLALQTMLRAGMWVQQPEPEWTLVGGPTAGGQGGRARL